MVVIDDVTQFDLLQQRIHPAESRVRMLAEQTPASFVGWDLLALGDEDLRAAPQAERRARIEHALRGAEPPVHLTPATRDVGVARDWFERFEGAGLDGVMAKPLGAAYQPGKRAMLKIKHARTAECAVAGFRWHKNGQGTHVGSLLLGLYDDGGSLHHVGVTSSFAWDRRAELAGELEPLRAEAPPFRYDRRVGWPPTLHWPNHQDCRKFLPAMERQSSPVALLAMDTQASKVKAPAGLSEGW